MGLQHPEARTRKVRCRHHTDPEGFEGIKQDMKIKASRGQPQGVDVEIEPFGSARPFPRHRAPAAETGAKGRGAYVEFDLPANALPIDVGPRNTARIPTGGMPLSLEGLNPTFVRVRWWQIWKW